MNYKKVGFTVVAAFDVSPDVVGSAVGGMIIRDESELPGYCARSRPDGAIICVPKDDAPAVVGRLYSCGIRAFWNFSHYDIASACPGAVVENVHLNDSLMTLSYLMENAFTEDDK